VNCLMNDISCNDAWLSFALFIFVYSLYICNVCVMQESIACDG